MPTRQLYRPVSFLEYQNTDPISVRFMRDCSENVNSYKAHFGAQKIISDFLINIPSISGTLENVMLVFGLFYISDGMTLRWWLNSKRTTGASGTTDWRLYASDVLYRGPRSIDYTFLKSYNYSTITTSAATNAIGYSSLALTDEIMKNNLIYLFLTSRNSGAGIVSTAYAIDVQMDKI